MTKNLWKGVFGACFWIWIGLTVGLIALMFAIPSGAKTAAGIIMASMMVLPIRSIVYKTIVWLTQTLMVNNAGVDAELSKFAVYRDIGDKSDVRKVNPGFFRLLWTLIAVVFTLIGLLCLVFRGISFTIVYQWLFVGEKLLRGGYSPIRVFLFVVLKCAYIGGILFLVRLVVNEYFLTDDGHFDRTKLWVILVAIAVFYVQILVSWALLGLSPSILGCNLLYKSIVTPIAIVLGYFAVWRFEHLLGVV